MQFGLSLAYGPVVLKSVDTVPYSYLSFTPAVPITFNDLTHLSVVYSFTEGNCAGGSLRWSVRVSSTQSIFIYYGATPNFNDCTTAGASQSGIDMLTLSDARFDTTQIPGGTFYDTYAHAKFLAGTMPVIRASLVMDSVWALQQVAVISNATVNGNTFVLSGGSPTCELPPATIQVMRESGSPTGVVNEVVAVGPPDHGDSFRIVDCKYKYNLLLNPLGAGRYRVDVLINGTDPAVGPAFFDLR